MQSVVHRSAFTRVLVLLVLLGVFVVGVTTILIREISFQENAVEKEVQARANALREYLLVAKHLLYGLRGSMQQHLYLAEAGALHFSTLAYIGDVPEYNIYALISDSVNLLPADTEPALSLVGSLTGEGSIASISEDYLTEINAALSLNALLGSVVSSLPDAKWVYYVSAKKFIYLAPAVSVDEYYFSEEHLQKAFWQEAIPESNPTLELVVTDVYMDAAGKGLMISLSLPVLYQHEFRGVLAVDIGIDSLVRELTGEPVMGVSALIDEHRNVIVKEAAMRDSMVTLDSGEMQFVEPILDNQVTLLHKVPNQLVLLSSLKASFARVLLLATILVLVYLVYYQLRLVQRIRRLADTDPLTKLMNRRAMTRIVESMICYNARYQQHIGVLLVDIDHFKHVNDRHGHATGDEVLKEIAEEIVKTVRGADQISRHGGEEFLLVLPNSNLGESYQLAERMRKAVSQTLFSSKHVPLTISVGCAELKNQETYSDVLRRADEALYRAKARGRNRCERAA